MPENLSKYILLPSCRNRPGDPIILNIGDIELECRIGFYDYARLNDEERGVLGIYTNDSQAKLLSDRVLSISEMTDRRDPSKVVYKLRIGINPLEVPIRYRLSMDTAKPFFPFLSRAH